MVNMGFLTTSNLLSPNSSIPQSRGLGFQQHRVFQKFGVEDYGVGIKGHSGIPFLRFRSQCFVISSYVGCFGACNP